MKYNQPYGVSDPNAAYINGNPSTGTMGSIPPAASIEHPQREIVAVISGARMTPDPANLMQMVLAIQSGQLIYADDAGVANSVQVVTSPNFGGAFLKGFVLVTKAAADNTGPATVTINGAGIWPIVHASDRTPLNALDITAGAMHALAFDGAQFQLVWSARAAGGPAYLLAPRTYYVNGATGDDSYDGTVAAHSTGSHGPFKTLQKAANQVPLFNLNGFSITVYVADYNAYGAFYMPKINGSGIVYWRGNATTPANCVITSPNLSTIQCNNVGGTVFIEGFKIVCNGPGPALDGMVGILASGAGTVLQIGAMEFGICMGAHLSATQGAMITNASGACPWKITGGSPGSPYLGGYFLFNTVTGNFLPHSLGGPAISIPTALAFNNCFVSSSYNSFVALQYSSLTGAGVAGCTGKRYDVSYNSSIATNSGGASYYPGSIAGTQQPNGGYYT